jgi:ribosomal-protein-alanine N-acetyltransferase
LRIDTERLILRPMEEADAADLHVVYEDPSTFEYIGAGPARSIDETLERIALKAAHHEEHGFALWSVVEKASGRVIGDCGLQMLEGGPEVELGYKLARDSRGKGYATEAARASVDFGFEQAGLDRIVAVAWPGNRASRGVMEKVGMTLAGRGVFYGNESVLYEIRRTAPATPAG